MMKNLLMLFLIAISSTGVQATSFDCSKATYQAEKAVCATPKLSQLDEQMAKLFFAGKNKSSNPSEFTRVQMDWIKGVRLCEADTVCLERSYTLRIEQLSQVASSSNSASASSTSTGQGSQLSQLNGEWYSNQWKYGYTLTNGVGVATSTNSPNFKVGDRIIFLQQSSDKTFEGTQVYTDGKFYKITVQQQSNDTLLFKGEKNVSWTMTRIGQATALSVASLTTASSAPQRQSNLPQCQGTNITTWNMCVGTQTFPAGAKYVGEWKDGKYDGRGTYAFADGRTETGIWQAGMRMSEAEINREALRRAAAVARNGQDEDRRKKEAASRAQTAGNTTSTAAAPVTPLTSASSVPMRQSQVPPCQGPRNIKWTMCQGTVTFTDGRRYVGEFKDDKLNGQGTITFADGGRYVGEFKDDKLNGQGTFTFADGGRYVGELKNDKLDGQGTLSFSNGDKYVGEWKDDKLDGQGTLSFSNGDKYVGEFKDDKLNGQGTFTFADGRRYVGEWKDDKRDGQGTYTFASGNKYVGEWKDNKRNGQGTFRFFNDDKYIGEFKDDKLDGQGTYTLANGSKYVGEFKDGKPHGQGTLTSSNGTVLQKGSWTEGILVTVVISTSTDTTIDSHSLMQRAKQGNAEAQYHYGMQFINGTGDEVKPRIAIEWLMKAQAQGHEGAKKQIASMFDLGIQLSTMAPAIKVYE
jgi:hypothetical protein